MIGIVGHMSGGKTYTAVEYMLDYLLRGNIVCSNIKLNCQGVTSYLQVPCLLWKRNYYLLVEGADTSKYHEIDIRDYKNYPQGAPRGSKDYSSSKVYIFYDEVSSVFDSLTSGQDKKVQEIAVWARHTQKRGQELYLIMQFSNELHKRLRSHITEFITCVNTENLRIPLFKTRLPFFLRDYVIRTLFAPDEKTQLQSSQWFKRNPEIYKCYDTGQIMFGHSTNIATERYSLDFTMRKISIARQVVTCQLIALVMIQGAALVYFILRLI